MHLKVLQIVLQILGKISKSNQQGNTVNMPFIYALVETY